MATGILSDATHDSAYVRSLLWGTKWDSNNLTYAIPYADHNKTWGFFDSTVPQIRNAVEKFSDVTNLTFRELDPDSFSADITFFDSYDVDLMDAYGMANPPMEEGRFGYNHYKEGDVLLNYDFSEKDYNYGNDGYLTLIHEFGHAVGLAHPHDDGGGSSIFPGVRGEYDLGEKDLNDIRYTIMSYNDKGLKVLPITPMAFDIAALQAIYGASDNNTGDTVYNLYNAIDGYYECIWDTGGSDTIAYYSSYMEAIDHYMWGWGDVVIDLRAATLIDGDTHAGGYFSGSMEDTFDYEGDDRGGFYIAHGVIIENIKSGIGDDMLYGNDANNYIEANNGDDVARGGMGQDNIFGGEGDDFLFGESGLDRLYGGGENDHIDGGSHNDYLNGAGGNDKLYGGLGDDLIHAGVGNDVARGGLDQDSILGGRGDDFLYGEGGLDRLYGEDGNDHIDGGGHDDYLSGGNGDDTLYGQWGNDRLYGEDENDYLYGGDHNDFLSGGSGNDKLYGQQGNDLIHAGIGNDVVRGGLDQDDVLGGRGDDKLFGESGLDRLYGEDGNDHIDGGGHSDYLDGGNGNDKLYGQWGNDTILGGSGNDVARGGLDQDNIFGGEGDDFLFGESGLDRLYGEDENDHIDGGGHDDYLDGGDGSDKLYGQWGNDAILGGSGHDIIIGGRGDDVLYGGGGNDEYYYHLGDGSDTIYESNNALFYKNDSIIVDFAQKNIRASFNGNDLNLDFGSGDNITIVNYGLGLEVENLIFTDATIQISTLV